MKTLRTAREAAALLQCSARKVTKTATENGIGVNLGGRAGFRFTEDEIDALRLAMHTTEQAAS